MRRERRMAEEIIHTLRDAESMEASGSGGAEVVQRRGVGGRALSGRRKQFQGIGDDQIRQLKQHKQPQAENARRRKAAR